MRSGIGRLFEPAAGPVRETLGKEAALFGPKLDPRCVLRRMLVLDL
jgi:hypothetical protein